MHGFLLIPAQSTFCFFYLNPERDQVELNREKLAARSSEERALCSAWSCAKS